MKKQSEVKLSPLECEIMGIIWEFSGAPSVREVVDTAYKNGEKAYTTVQTVMNHLVEKGYLKKEKKGLANFYKPLVKKHAFVEKETDHFIDNIFEGSPLSLVNFLLGKDKLSREEISSLKQLIESREQEE